MEGLLRQGICTQATRQWLDQKQEPGPVRDSLLAQAYERLEECPSPATEWQAVREVLDDDDLPAALLVIRAISVRRYAKGERHCSDPFLWQSAGQPAGRWNRDGDEPVHYLA